MIIIIIVIVIEYIVPHHIMAARAFVVVKEVFIMETLLCWHCDIG